jgi:hypothetical protein
LAKTSTAATTTTSPRTTTAITTTTTAATTTTFLFKSFHWFISNLVRPTFKTFKILFKHFSKWLFCLHH